MTQIKHYFSIWLVPNTECLEPLQNLVDELAFFNKTPSFVPHMTLVSEFFDSAEAVVKMAQSCALQLGVSNQDLNMVINDWFEGNGTLFSRNLGFSVELEAKTQLILQEEAYKIFKGLGNKSQFLPLPHFHISLLYGKNRPNQHSIDLVKANLVRYKAGTTASNKLKFGKVYVIQEPAPIQSYADVAAWQTIAVINIEST